MAQKINKLTGNPAGIEFVPQRDWDTIKTRRGDISLLKSLFGFEPAFDLDEKLEETIKWFQDTGVE